MQRCCAKQFSGREMHSCPGAENQLWLMLHAVTARKRLRGETRVDAEQHGEATRAAEEAVSWWQEGPRVYRGDINIWPYQYTFIDGL